MKNKMMIGLMTASAVLAVMGCWFCWYCPSRIYEAHELFWKQIAGNVIGLVVFLGVVVLGWRRLLKVAPWLMGIWILAFVVAHCQRPINGAHRWLVLDGILPVPFSMIHINVLTCFMPAFALFVAWLHEKKWIRVWMRWCFWGALVFGAVWYVVGSESRMMRIVAFLHPSYETFRYSYMGEQLQAAFSVANWFGDSGHKLYLLPCPESDGMMAASALLFGKWFPTLVCVVFGFAGALLAMVWQGVLDVSKRWSVLLFAAWFLLPAAYCHFQALGLLPVAGFSPALVGASGTAVVMVWFGLGVLAAMMRDGQQMPKQSRYNWWGVGISMGVMIVAVLAMAWASHEDRKFYEKIPDKEPSDPFASLPERGAIVAADGSLLACPARKWSFHLDPKFPIDKDAIRSCADELSIVFELPKEKLLMDFLRTDSRYIPLKDVEDDGIEDLWYRNRGRHLKRYGLIREPLQGRRTLLGDAALPVVGTVHRTLAKQVPEGASGLEYLFDKVLKGKDGGSGGIVHTTIVPSLQKKFDAILVDACVTNSAKAAWGIALKIPFGEIVAMASVKGGTNGTVHSSYNGAAHCNFEPGGLVKPLTYAIALNEGILKWDSKLDQGEGIWEYNGNTIRDKVKGLVSISEALSNRVNIAACKTALEIGAEKFYEYLMRFGFGSKVSGRSVPGEETGIITSDKRWDVTTRAYVGMGYGIAVTGLQVAQAYAILANHGRMVRPRLVTKVIDWKSGNMLKDFMLVTNETTQVLSPASADAIARTLWNGIPATVQMVDGQSYSSANFIASCAGVFPHDKPKYAVLVTLENVNKDVVDSTTIKSVWSKVLRGIDE